MAAEVQAAEEAFFRDVYAAFVAYGEKAEETPCWRGLQACAQAGTRLEWHAFETGLPSQSLGEGASTTPGSLEKLPGNPGLGICFNAAANRAKALGKAWLMVFDSDFSPTPDLLSAYRQAVSRNPEISLFIPRVASASFTLSPYLTRLGRFRSTHLPTGLLPTRPWFWINNGMLIRLSIFEQAGGYHPGIPADFSDTLFCHRVRRILEKMALVPITLEHRHSAFAKTGKDKALERFRIYCLGSRLAGREMGSSSPHFFWAMMRALRLVARHRSAAFLPVPFQAWAGTSHG